MRWKIIVFLLAVVVLGVVFKKKLGFESQSFDVSTKDRIATSFELKGESEERNFASKKELGTPIVLHFWAAWCAPCLEEIPDFIEAANFYSGQKIFWIAVSGDSTWAEAKQVFSEKSETAWLRLFVDPELRLAEQMGTFQFPETYLLNSQHQVVTKWVGPQAWNSTEIRQKIDQTLKEAGK